MEQGIIISSYGRNYNVETPNGIYATVSKGKKNEYVVGDEVMVSIINDQQAQIKQLLPRRTLVYRSDHNRSKMIASNIDQLLIVVAVKPSFNLSFLNSCLVSAEAADIQPLIIINKMDLVESTEFAKDLVELYGKQLNYPILQLSALDNCTQLLAIVDKQLSLFIGQSGVGKSTLTNHLCPEAHARTGQIAKYENSGCHTTTNASLYHLSATSHIIDCPGLQEFGLHHLHAGDLAHYFPEMRSYLGQCNFSNCLHLSEPGCAIRTACANEQIAASRYEFYQRITKVLKLKKNY